MNGIQNFMLRQHIHSIEIPGLPIIFEVGSVT